MRLEDKENNKLIAPKRLMHKKCYNSDLLSLGKKSFNFYNILINKYRAYKR